MPNPHHIFSDEARQRINAAVADAESKTSAEIVPVIVPASGRYDRSEDMCGLFLSLVALITAWLLFQRDDPTAGGWDGPRVSLSLLPIILILVAGFITGSVLASSVGWICRLFTPRSEMIAEVDHGARRAFFDQRVHHTSAHTGVLIYVSLFERRAAILADDHIVEELGLPAINELCNQLTDRLRRVEVTQAVCESIRMLGDRLASLLPRTSGDVNELPDALIAVK